jgi:hypothetical protein
VVRYSVSVGAQHMAVSNGLEHYVFCRSGDVPRQLQSYPTAPG